MSKQLPLRAIALVVLLSILSVLLLAACAGPAGASGLPGLSGAPGAPGNPGNVGPQGISGGQGPAGASGYPGNPGAPGEPGLPGNPGAAGNTGPQGGAGISPGAAIVLSDGTMYIDSGFTIRGSGFQPFEPIQLLIDVGPNIEGCDLGYGSQPARGTQTVEAACYNIIKNPNLGFVDANQGGAFTLVIDNVGEDYAMVAPNILRMKKGEAVSVKADGLDGSQASAPIMLKLKKPVITPGEVLAADIPGTGASIVTNSNTITVTVTKDADAGTVDKTADTGLTVWGGGFQANEPVQVYIDFGGTIEGCALGYGTRPAKGTQTVEAACFSMLKNVTLAIPTPPTELNKPPTGPTVANAAGGFVLVIEADGLPAQVGHNVLRGYGDVPATLVAEGWYGSIAKTPLIVAEAK